MISEFVTLPSMGIPYSKLEGSSIRIQPITTKIYKDFLINNEENGELNILEECMVDSPVKAEELVYADQVALLFRIRSMSLGSDVKIRVHCPYCNKDVNLVWDILNADCDYLSVDTYPFEIELPESKTKVKVLLSNSKMKRFAREEAIKRAETFNRKVAEFLPQLLVCSQLRVPGYIDSVERIQWYETLSLTDSLYIDSVIEHIENFGISTRQTLVCPSCKKDLKVNMMIDKNFFRPNIDIPKEIFKTTQRKLAADLQNTDHPQS